MVEASGKDVYENLLESGIIKPVPPSEEKKILKIHSLNMNESLVGNFRYLSRMLRDKVNMPFAFWGNSSGGVHSGFFFEWPDYVGFERLNDYLNSNEIKEHLIEEHLIPVLKNLIDKIREMDPTKQFDLYWFI